MQRRETAAEVEQPQLMAELTQLLEDACRREDRRSPGLRVATWKETPAGARPSCVASASTAIASPVEQPYLRDSGQSEPSPEVTSRTITPAPGAASASLRVSSGESTAKSRTPRAYAVAMSSRRLTGLE